MQRSVLLRRTVSPSQGDDSQGISLWKLLERSARPLSRIAGCWPVEINYGEAAAVNLGIPDEVIERILFNLVRDAAAALDSFQAVVASGGYTARLAQPGPLRRSCDWAGASHTQPQPDRAGVIRIGAGLLDNRIGSARPWPFRRTQLTVEDTGCGIEPGLLQQLLSGSASSQQSAQRLGLCGAQRLVVASGGELLAESDPGYGTCVQIAWPVVPVMREAANRYASLTTDVSLEVSDPPATLHADTAQSEIFHTREIFAAGK